MGDKSILCFNFDEFDDEKLSKDCLVDLEPCHLACSVSNCSTNSLSETEKNKLVYITCPKDPSRFTEWMRTIDRIDLISKVGTRKEFQILLCLKHFSASTWMSASTRFKRLQKSAVPDIHLTKSAPPQKEVISNDNLKATHDSVLSLNDVKPSSATFSKVSKKELNMEFTLKINDLQSELDKKVDHLINQKNHYEDLLCQERLKCTQLEKRIKKLLRAQNKLCHAYESQIEAYETVFQVSLSADSEEIRRSYEEKSSISERREKKCWQQRYERSEHDQDNLDAKNCDCQSSNVTQRLESQLSKFISSEPSPSERVSVLSSLLKNDSFDVRKELTYKLASEFLTPLQLSMFSSSTKPEVQIQNLPNELQIFCIEILEKSSQAYSFLSKSLNLPSEENINQWKQMKICQNGAGDYPDTQGISDIRKSNKSSTLRGILKGEMKREGRCKKRKKSIDEQSPCPITYLEHDDSVAPTASLLKNSSLKGGLNGRLNCNKIFKKRKNIVDEQSSSPATPLSSDFDDSAASPTASSVVNCVNVQDSTTQSSESTSSSLIDGASSVDSPESAQMYPIF